MRTSVDVYKRQVDGFGNSSLPGDRLAFVPREKHRCGMGEAFGHFQARLGPVSYTHLSLSAGGFFLYDSLEGGGLPWEGHVGGL